MMKKYFLLFLICLIASMLKAQLVNQNDQSVKKQSDLDWYNCSFDRDGVYGAEINKAYEFLKGKKMKKRPVIALIGSGLDVEHEDLKQAIWFNKKEKADGKDNDKNGLVDDINGWNFIGGKDGQVMEKLMQEGDREYLRLKDKYADYLQRGESSLKLLMEKERRFLLLKIWKNIYIIKIKLSRNQNWAKSMKGCNLLMLFKNMEKYLKRN